jgi:hypothetical protein
MWSKYRRSWLALLRCGVCGYGVNMSALVDCGIEMGATQKAICAGEWVLTSARIGALADTCDFFLEVFCELLSYTYKGPACVKPTPLHPSTQRVVLHKLLVLHLTEELRPVIVWCLLRE